MDYRILARNNSGSIEHFYHFIFGLLFPFVQNNKPNSGHTFYFDNCGPMNRHFEIPGYDLVVGKKGKKISFMGFDFTDYRHCNFNLIKQRLLNAFEIEENPSDEIIFVDRDKPDRFYQTIAKIKGSGSSRRHIPNMDEVVELVSEKFHAKKIFLENMSLKEQIQIFQNAKMVVLQHGAAMSNIIWCKQNTPVLEIRNSRNLNCYDALARRNGIMLKKLVMQANNFSKINPNTLLSHIQSLHT